MVTKGIIKTLDLTGNTCTVRLPLFETAGNDHIIGTATISNTPGSYNGYKEGDVVWIAFEDGSMNSPVVIGKLYLGVEEERKDPRGVLNVENSTVAKTASMPADTKLSVQTDSNVPNTTSPFGSLSSIANNLNTLNTTVAQNNRDYGNRFKQVITDAKGLQSTLEQTAAQIRAEVKDTEEGLNSTLDLHAGEIAARVLKNYDKETSEGLGEEYRGFSWSLDENGWRIYSEDTTHTALEKIGIFSVDNSGVKIAGDLQLVGYPKVTITSYYSSITDEDADITVEGNKKVPTGGIANAEADIALLATWWGYDLDTGSIDTEHSSPYYGNLKNGTGEDAEDVAVKWVWRLSCEIGYEYSAAENKLIEIVKNIAVECIYYPEDEIENNGTGNPVRPPNNKYRPNEALVVARGKSTNYYSKKEPFYGTRLPAKYARDQEKYELYANLKVGDCWFNTNYIQVNPTPSKASEYIGKWIISGTEGEEVLYTQVTPENLTSTLSWIKPGTTIAYEYGKLSQCSAIDTDGKATWEDIGGELVTNKLTANYINALEITAKKIEVHDDSSNLLFSADGTTSNREVKIAGFDVNSNNLQSANFISKFEDEPTSNTGIYLGTDGIKLGKHFSVDNTGTLTASSVIITGLTASDVGARPDSWTPSASDVGARPNTWTPSASDVGAIATGDLTNSSSTAYSNIVSIANGCITAASIDAGKITSGSLTIDNKFIADIDRSTVKIGSFDVDGNSLSMGLYDENGDFIGDGQSAADTPLGKTGSLIVCAAGSSTKARIGGSTFVSGWHYTAGRNFGVRTDPTTKESELYASRGKIGNWNILPRTALCESINGIPDYGYTDPERGNEKTNLVFLYSGSKYKTYDAVSEALTDGFNLGRPDSFEPGCLTVGGNWISPDQNCDFYNNYSYTQLRGGKLGGVQFGVTNLYKGQDYEIYCPMLALWDLGAKDVAQIGNPDIHGEYARDEKYKGSGIALLRHGYVPGDVLTGGTESTWFLCGSWVAESAISIISDRRKKEDIKELNDQYDSLFDQLKPTTFKYKNGNSGRLHTGFIAQDIEEALKKSNLKTTEFAGLVIRNHNYFDDKLQKEQQSTEYSLRYEEFVALNTNQIQKLKTKVKSLEDKIAELEELLKTK